MIRGERSGDMVSPVSKNRRSKVILDKKELKT